MEAAASPAAFSCVEDDAGERSVAPPPLEEVAEDGGPPAEVTATATPATCVVDEATAVSITVNIFNVDARR